MADSHRSGSTEHEQQSPPAGDVNNGTSPSNQGLKLENDESSRVNIKPTKLVCHNCGTHVLPISPSLPTVAVPAQGSINTHVSSDTVSELILEESKETKKKKKNIRIARLTRNAQGDEKLADYTDLDTADPDNPNSENYVFAIVREFNFLRRDLNRPEESLVLISPVLAKAYRSVVKDFAGARLGRLGRMSARIPEPFASLFFYYGEISEAARSTEFACEEDFDVLAQYYSERILPEHERTRALIAEGMVQYDDLWALFRPGDLIYSLEECSEQCLQMLIRTEYKDDAPGKTDNRMVAETWRISWDHSTSTFNRVVKSRAIRPFSGSRLITSLPFYPMKYYNGGPLAALREQLEIRGRRWKDLMSQTPRCLHYSGPARSFTAYEDEYLSERVIIDGSISTTLLSSITPVSNPLTENSRTIYENSSNGAGLNSEYQHFDNFPKGEDFNDLQAQLCPSTAICYGVKSRMWYVIAISRTEEVEWQGDDTLEQLVLEESTKKMLIGLVRQHQVNKGKILSDIIPSKGKGLIIVLHGSPGVGKTLTAEVVAEYTKKPLYPINIGELTSEENIVSKLQWHFTIAARWDAVLLLDEADVLLEKRSYEDFKRNGIVSVFLRMLEYYDGMLFLTTNRIMTIDPAFQSRIQIAIKFPDLTPHMRRQIWENFINRLDKREVEGKKELFEHLEDMKEWNLNGRQIRNVLTIAESLALSLERRRGALRYDQVEEVVNQTLQFQSLFGETTKEQKAQLVNLNPRQFQEKSIFRIQK